MPEGRAEVQNTFLRNPCLSLFVNGDAISWSITVHPGRMRLKKPTREERDAKTP
jgi:hypothetical protein